MSEHARLSPSAIDRWGTCPGSVALSMGMPEKTSEHAQEGTRAHALAEANLKNKTVEAVDPVMGMHVRVYTEHVRELASKPGAVLHVEVRVKATDDVWGTADAVVWEPGSLTLYVRDLKYGAGVGVEVRDNGQLKVYALAALLTMKYRAQWVDIGIVQPRKPHPDGLIRSVRFRVVDLIEFHAELLSAVRKVNRTLTVFSETGVVPADALVPGEKACHWCLAAPKCPKVKEKAQALAKKAFAPGLPYDPNELAEALVFLPILESWIKNTRELAYNEAERGNAIPGHKLVEKRAVRKWRNDIDKGFLAELLNVGLVSLFKPEELLPVSDILKLAPGKNDKERAALLEPFVTKESSGHTLVADSDPREPIRVDAKSAFQDA